MRNQNFTIKKHAPNMVAFIRTSKSIGKLIPKKSASVNISRANPDHCLDILPTWSPFTVTIYRKVAEKSRETEKNSKKQGKSRERHLVKMQY